MTPRVPARTLGVLVAAAGGKAAALLLIAEGVARLIVEGDAGGAVLAAAGVVLRAAAGWVAGVTGRRAAAQAKLSRRRDLARGVVDRDLDAGSVAALAARGLDDLDGWFTGVVPAAVAAVVVPLGLGARILGLDLVSAATLAVTLPLVPLFLALIGMHSRDAVVDAQAALARLADHVAELARGLPVLVGLGRDTAQTDRLAAIQREHTRRTGTVLRTAFLSALALELLATISVAVVAVFLGLRLLSGDVTLADALIVLLLAPECFTALRELGVAHHAAEDGRAALDRVRTLLAGGRERPVRPAGDGLRLRGLRVRYAGRRTPSAPPLDLDVARGEIVALAGASGAGKSTVLGAIAGVLPADARVTGELAGGARLGYAPQDPRTVGETVREELALYAEGGDVDGMLAELDLAAVADRACGLLSPGERRRLAVGRALLRVDAGAGVLLLDEPTAHLDDTAANRVRRAIVRRRPVAATVLVGHDPTTTALADRVVRLDTPRAPIPFPLPDESPLPPAAATAAPGAVRREPLSLAHVARLVVAPAAGWWVLSSALAVLATGMGLALTAVSGWLIVRASEQPAIMYLLVAIVGVRFFGIGRAVARYAERLVTHRAAFGATDAVRLLLWRGIAARSAGSRDLLEGGRAVDHLVGTVAVIRDALPRILPPLAAAVLAVAGVALTVELVAPAATGVVATALLVALAAPGAVAFAAGRDAERRRVTGGGRLLREVAALGGASRDLRANGVAGIAVARVDADAAEIARAECRAAPVVEAAPVVTAAIAGLAAVVAGLVLTGTGTSTATVAVVVLLVLAAGDPVAAGAAAVQRLPALQAALGAVARLLAIPASAEGGDLPVDRVDVLRLDGVAVSWPGTRRAAVAGVSAEVRRGEWLAVTGPSGAGKSTLLTALLGGVAPSAGRILVNGVALGRLRTTDWRRRVAWCPQDAHVFDSTLRGNLALAQPAGADEGAMRDVLRRVGLEALTADLEDGLDGRVGPGGRALSGGERQRLAVARALLADADVVLLDEPTAHLDPPTADDLLADLRAALADRIVVIVTHRAADLRPGDRVVRLGAREPASSLSRVE